MKDLYKYGKAKGELLVRKYLPKRCPFESIDIISTIKEWEAIKDNYREFIFNRVDYPIGKAEKNAAELTSDNPESIPDLIKKVNMQGPNGVVLCMKAKEKGVHRYENDGAFNILFNMGHSIIIELVGKGFDGHELTQGLALHEYYIIPWEKVLFMGNRKDLEKDEDVIKRFVDSKAYAKQRENRVKMLKDKCYHNDFDKIEENVPKEYKKLDDNIIRDILDNIVFEMVRQENKLRRDSLTKFGVQGNIVRGKAVPWEIFVPERWMRRDINKDKGIDSER